MAFAAARVRAVAVSGLVVLTLLTATSVTSVASAAPLPAVELAATATPTSSSSTTTLAARVIADARSHLGARYVWGAKGPRVFDCIGLVLRTYSEAGVLGRLGGWGNASGYALLHWARIHHMVSTTNGQPGDVVVWGGGGHVGIYLGHGMAISALVSGVRIHGIYAVTKRFTAFIHTGLNGVQVPRTIRTTTVRLKAIGTRHAGPAALLRIGHFSTATVFSHLRPGTAMRIFQVWKDSKGHAWYRVNAGTHVGWVLAAQTRA